MPRSIQSTIVFILFTVSLLLAQNDVNKKNSQDDINDNVVEKNVISLSEISRKANEIHISLNKISESIKPLNVIVEMEKSWPSIRDSIKKTLKSLDYKNLELLSTNKLQNLFQEWNINLERLKVQEQSLFMRLETLEKTALEIKNILVIWEQTAEVHNTKDTPEAIRKRIRTILNDIKQTNRQLLKRQEKVLTLRDQISVEEIKIAELISRINEAEVRLRNHLFAVDGAPLLELLFNESDSISLSTTIKNSSSDLIRISLVFINANSQRIYLHLIIYLLLIILLYYLKFEMLLIFFLMKQIKKSGHRHLCLIVLFLQVY